jgi:tetratricopeptide (TPR) repeat protein
MSKSKNVKTNKQKTSQFFLNKNVFISLSLITLLTLVVYSPGFQASFLNWDDDVSVTENYLIRNLTPGSIKNIFFTTSQGGYNPMIFLTFAIEYHFYHLNPARFHITNIILHLINSLLVFWLIFLICKNNIISFLTALFFCIHPLHVEAVAWITARKDVLYTLFYLSSIVAYIYYLRKNKKNLFYALSIILFILSVLSKPVAVTLPAILILIDYYQKGKFEVKFIYDKIPFFIISIVFSVVTITKGTFETKYTAFDNVLIFFHSILFYLYKLILPVNLAPVYPGPSKTNGMMPLIYFLAPIIILGLTFYVIKHKRNYLNLMFACLFFIITILPVSNIILIVNSSLVFDRFTYVPYIGLFFFISTMVYYLYNKTYVDNKKKQSLIISISVFLIIILSYLSFQRANVWKDSITLWSDMIEKYPDNPDGFCYRAEAYNNIQNFNNALSDYNTAIKIDSTKDNFFNDRGNLFRNEKEFDKAILDYEKAIQINPKSWVVYNNLGIVYTYKKKYDEALNCYDKSVDQKSDYSHPYINKGNLYSEKQNYDSSMIAYNKAVEIDPYYPNTFFLRAKIYNKKQDYQQAIIDFNKAISLDPDFETAYQQLTITYFLAKDYNKAWDNIYTMRSKKYPLDKQFIETLQKESGRNY